MAQLVVSYDVGVRHKSNVKARVKRGGETKAEYSGVELANEEGDEFNE